MITDIIRTDDSKLGLLPELNCSLWTIEVVGS